MRIAILLLGVGFLGCGDDGPAADPYQCMAGGGAGCFEVPTQKVGAADPTTLASTPVNLTCTAYESVDSAGPIGFSGTTVGATDHKAISIVRIEMFRELTLATSLADVTSDSGADNMDLLGTYTASVAVMPSQYFVRTTKAGNLTLHLLYQRLDVAQSQYDMFDIAATTRTAVAGVLEHVGDQYQIGKTQLFATANDCNGNRLVNVVANVAASSGANGSRLFEPGVKVYYTTEVMNTPPIAIPTLGRRTELMQTTPSGGFAASNLSSGHHFVQIWGYVTDADVAKGSAGLTLLAEKEIVAPTTETAILVPLYGRQ